MYLSYINCTTWLYFNLKQALISSNLFDTNIYRNVNQFKMNPLEKFAAKENRDWVEIWEILCQRGQVVPRAGAQERHRAQRLRRDPQRRPLRVVLWVLQRVLRLLPPRSKAMPRDDFKNWTQICSDLSKEQCVIL